MSCCNDHLRYFASTLFSKHLVLLGVACHRTVCSIKDYDGHGTAQDARTALETATVQNIVDEIVTLICQDHQQQAVTDIPEAIDAACSPLPSLAGPQLMLSGTAGYDTKHDSHDLSPIGWALKQAAEFLTERMQREATPVNSTPPGLENPCKLVAAQDNPSNTRREATSTPGGRCCISKDSESAVCVADDCTPIDDLEDDASSREIIANLSESTVMGSQHSGGVRKTSPGEDASSRGDEVLLGGTMTAPQLSAFSIPSPNEPSKTRQAWMPSVPFRGQAASPGGILAFFGAHRGIVNRHVNPRVQAAPTYGPVSAVVSRQSGCCATPTASWQQVTNRLNQLRANLEVSLLFAF